MTIIKDGFIFEFPEHIQKRIDAGKGCDTGCGEGWLQIIIDLDKKLNEISPDYVINQIKEKLRGLRFYVDKIEYDEKVDELINDAAYLSPKTCEVCGKKGKRRDIKGLWFTRCKKHKKV